METAEHREPYESRGSRTDLGAPGGESPPGDSTTPTAQKAAVMRKVGPEFDVMDNEKGLDGSRPITEGIATQLGGDDGAAPGAA
jgi:hypothetical protein